MSAVKVCAVNEVYRLSPLSPLSLGFLLACVVRGSRRPPLTCGLSLDVRLEKLPQERRVLVHELCNVAVHVVHLDVRLSAPRWQWCGVRTR